MSYLYSKLPETGVSPHIGTGGDEVGGGQQGIVPLPAGHSSVTCKTIALNLRVEVMKVASCGSTAVKTFRLVLPPGCSA